MQDRGHLYKDKRYRVAKMVSEGASKQEISDQTGIPYNTLTYHMKKWGIKRAHSDYSLQPIAKNSKYFHLKDKAKELCLKGLPTPEIAKELGIPLGSIHYALKSLGLSGVARASRGKHLTDDAEKIVKASRVGKYRTGKDHHYGGKAVLNGRVVDKKKLISKVMPCIESDMTYREIAKEFNMSSATVAKVLKEKDLLLGPRKGPRSRNWIGGHKKYRGPGWQTQRKLCLQRDGYKCRDCGRTNAEELKDLKRQLSAHHLVPYEVGKDSSLENLITVCQSCHMKREHKEGTFSGTYFPK